MKNQFKKCPHCLSTNLSENEQGNQYCQDCGRVIETTKFLDNVSFANLKMTGQVVDKNESNNRGTLQKRIKRAKDKIHELTKLLEIDDDQAVGAATRIIMIASQKNFFDKGRNIDLYAAAALYVILRYQKAPYLLIDFSDKMGVNLFKLGKCFRKLSRYLGFLGQLPGTDPSLYIKKYCIKLNLGEKTPQVALTAIRLVQRMKRDWICQGRRPSSLCGAAILIAAKIHDVKCSTNDICKSVFVCDETIRRRLQQFKQTNVAKLTREQFQKMQQNLDDLQGQMDPPAFTKARIRSQQQKLRKQNQLQKIMLLQLKKQKKQKDNDDNQQWSNYHDNLNIPQEIIDRQVKRVQRGINAAKQKFIDQSLQEESVNLSSNTDDDIFLNDQDDQSFDSEIKQDEVRRYIHSQEEQQRKKTIWEDQNKDWLHRQELKKLRMEKTPKRKSKKNLLQIKYSDPFEAVKNTKVGDAVNDEQLKKLLGSKPKKPEQQHTVNLKKVFQGFQFDN